MAKDKKHRCRVGYHSATIVEMKPRLIIGLAILCSSTYGQRFDVVSIKPHLEPIGRHGPYRFDRMPGGHEFRATIKLDALIQRVYRVPWDCVVAKNAAWISTDWWDLDAKSEKPFTEPEMFAALKELMATRFKLQVKTAQRPGTVYVLGIAPGGLKIKKNEDAMAPLQVTEFPDLTAIEPTMVFDAKAITMREFVSVSPLMQLETPVVDATGVTARYDIHWLVSAPRHTMEFDNMAPALIPLGLKLEEKKGQVDILNITHVEKPTEN
jgi:uncharacterized protein (TIGR03435 family)